MEDSGREDGMTTELRRSPACSGSGTLRRFVCTHRLARWLVAERAGMGVVLDVSLNDANVMSPASMNLGYQLAISLRLPDQTATMNVDATVRWPIVTLLD